MLPKYFPRENIKIIDTASGSGSFQIKVLREVYNCYMLIEQKTAWINKTDSVDFFDQPKNYQDTKAFRQKHFLNSNNVFQLQLISKIILGNV